LKNKKMKLALFNHFYFFAIAQKLITLQAL